MNRWGRRHKPDLTQPRIHACTHITASTPAVMQVDYGDVMLRLCPADAAALHAQVGAWLAVNRPTAVEALHAVS